MFRFHSSLSLKSGGVNTSCMSPRPNNVCNTSEDNRTQQGVGVCQLKGFTPKNKKTQNNNNNNISSSHFTGVVLCRNKLEGGL